MIEIVDKGNKSYNSFHMFKKLEGLSMIIEQMEDTKMHSNQTAKDEN